MADASVPKWRADFPFTAEGEDEVTRREFARYLVLASAGLRRRQRRRRGVDVAAADQSRRAAARSSASSALRDGAALLFRYPTEHDPAILVRLPGGELRAFSQKCTHLGCVVYWSREQRADALPLPRRRLRRAHAAASSPARRSARSGASTSRCGPTAWCGRSAGR